MPSLKPARALGSLAVSASLLAAGALLAGCGDEGDRTYVVASTAPPPSSTVVDRTDDLPGVVLAVTAIAPGSGPGGNLQAGDQVSVTFTLHRRDGTRLALSELDSAGILLSGPTDNYQPVFPERTDVQAQAVENQDGSYTYTFSDPLPGEYDAPANDTKAFGIDDGELKGEPLRDGTYTVAVQGSRVYTVDGASYRDPGVAIEHLLVGSATTVTPREVVKNDNCDQCHSEVRAHGGRRTDVRSCVLCHTAGAEDKNTGSVANGTPGLTIDFRTMIHKIHNGANLPSVQGVSGNSDGSRRYDTVTAVPVKPYEVVGHNDAVHDYSQVASPVWPSLSSAMPRDLGYSALTVAEQGRDTAVRRGLTDCARCHGDPDGAGPRTAPDQGGLAFAQPTRNACGSCHDDIDWAQPYKVNSPAFLMPPQADDASCKTCHDPTTLAGQHLHPLVDPALNAGLVLTIATVAEAGPNNADGDLDPGERVQVTFTARNDAGAAFAPTGAISAAFAGPLTNRNRLLGISPGNGSVSIPTLALVGAAGGPYTVNLPEPVFLELVGTASAGVDTFTTLRAPLWDAMGAATTVLEFSTPADVTSGATTLSASAAATQNFLDVASATGFAGGNGTVGGATAGDFARISDGVGADEYVQVGYVDGARLWLKQALRRAFPVGATVTEVTRTARTLTTHYTVDAATGTITEAGATTFTTGRAIVVSYTSDFILPAVYPPAVNDTRDLDETWGEWSGKPLVSGVYRLTLWSSRSFTVAVSGETQSYSWASLGASKDVSVGTSGGAAPLPVISSVNNCSACHVEVIFHGGGRRGLDTCIACHGTAGIEDKPLYLDGQGRGAATPGVTVDFRQMLHRIHMGKDLSDPTNYVVVGNSGSLHTYEGVVFPPMKGGTKQCAVCHGEGSTSWLQPQPRDHPTAQGLPARVWRVACTSCHDGQVVAAHVDAQTGLGVESCLLCHGPGADEDVESAHRPR